MAQNGSYFHDAFGFLSIINPQNRQNPDVYNSWSRMAILYLSVIYEKGKEAHLIRKKNMKREKTHHFLFALFALLISLFIFNHVLAADDKKKDDKPAATPAGPPVPIYIPPLPRHVEFPPITYGKEASIEGETELNITKMRFWYVAILASWNVKSNEIADILNKNYKVFTQRNVGVIALYSNDTKESVANWRKKNNPLFMNEFASRNFLDALKNPKIPTVWVIGNLGEVLQRLELPTKEEMQKSVEKVMILTAF